MIRASRRCVVFASAVLPLLASCTQSQLEKAVAPARSVQPLAGQDGAFTVNGVVRLNEYTALATNTLVGATSLTVADVSQLDSVAFGPLGAGDLLLVYQAQGAGIDVVDTPSWGGVTAFNSAGLHEFVEVASVSGNTITLSSGCAGLRNPYTVVGRAQVVRVPQFSTLTVSATGTVTALPWDGTRGGIIALHVRDTLSLQGTIDVAGLGFRGGQPDTEVLATPANDVLGYRSSNGALGGEKGESIVGFQATYDALGGRYGRGAPANAGGGGNAYRAGGGGGANATNTNAWSGQGVMDGTAIGAQAWQLDPGRALPTNTGGASAITNNGGGGRGGYSFSASNQNAVTTPPANSSWNGNLRRERGGLGGRPLDPSATGRLYFGGGGGAGDGDQSSSGGGGRGGGLIYVMAGTVSGTGALVANGAPGGDTVGSHRDAAGGGGGGGTVVVRANFLSGFSISANGGQGGNQLISSGLDEATGPGGGGGGGFIATQGGNVTRSAAGGPGGTTTSNGLTEFPTNGATRGASGNAAAVVATNTGTQVVDVPLCLEPANLEATITNSVTSSIPGTSTTYVVRVRNLGPGPASGTRVVNSLPGIITAANWTCAGSGAATCPASGTGSINALVTIPANEEVVFTVNASINPAATGALINGVSVFSPPTINDPTLTNNFATDTDTLTPRSDLSLSVLATPSPVDEDANVVWTVNVTNGGESTATTVRVNFPLPAETNFISASGTNWTCSRTLTLVTCLRSALGPGNAEPILIVSNVLLAGGMLTSAVSVTSSVPDPFTINNDFTITTTVNPVNDSPVNTVPMGQTIVEDTFVTFSAGTGNAISVDDVDLGTGNLTMTLTATAGTASVTVVPNITFVTGDGTDDVSMSFTGRIGPVLAALASVTFRPLPDFSGTASLRVVSNDNGNSGNGGARGDDDTISIVVTPVNDPPTVRADTFTVDEDSMTMLNVLANDSSAPDGPETLTIVAVSVPTNGMVTNGGSIVTYRPNANYFGADSFSYTVSDGNGGLSTAVVSVTVMPVNDPPTAVNDTFGIVEGAMNVVFDVLQNDSPSPDVGEALVVISVTSPSNGMASVAPGGAGVRYTP
ncbi:MAG: cadherin-like domain-containing protein, partial [Myxococcaceae bacterium]|nr:cadherin-like domain-containing protein [Myxococcaceae bacterium]